MSRQFVKSARNTGFCQPHRFICVFERDILNVESPSRTRSGASLLDWTRTMPNCDFYATPVDHAGILSWLFAEGECHCYELGSDCGMPLKQFKSAEEVLQQFERSHPSGTKWKVVHLQLDVIGAGPPFKPRRVTLDPKACDGATFRYDADGWGLIQLYLSSATPGGLDASH